MFLTVLDSVASYTLSYIVYIDDLSRLLSGLPVAGLCGNHVSYADDMYLLSLSALGLQTLVHVCLVFAVKHDIIYNVRKPVCMLTRSRKYTMSYGQTPDYISKWGCCNRKVLLIEPIYQL